MTVWRCQCGAKHTWAATLCDACGEVRGHCAPPSYVPPWHRPEFKPSRPTDVCDVPGCWLTVREHIETFVAAGERIRRRVVRL